MILVTGATGHVGRHIVQQLVAAGHQVRMLCRPSHTPVRDDVDDDVDVAYGDLSDATAVRQALVGVDKVFLFPAMNIAPDIGAMAHQQGAQRIVVLSSAANERTDPRRNPIAAKHDRAEKSAQSIGDAWTILRSDTFATNALAWAAAIRSSRKVRAPFGLAQRNPIHEADVAAAVVASLLQDGHERKTYLLTGPESMTQRQQVQHIGAAIGEPIAFEEQTREDAYQEMSARMPAAAANQLLNYMEASVGVPSHVLDTVRTLTRRSPRRFAQWADDHAADFR